MSGLGFTPLNTPILEAPPSLDVLVALHACDTATPLSLYYVRPRVHPFEHANPGGPALFGRNSRAARVRHGDTPFLVLFQASG